MKIRGGNEIQAIHVYYSEKLNDTTLFHSLLNGVEEEGVPYLVKERQDGVALELSYQAALDSSLGVGIGIGEDGQIILHNTKLVKNQPLFTIHLNETYKQRALGTNAARLVKGIPFKSFDEIKDSRANNESVEIQGELITEEDIATIVAIVLKRLQEMK